MSKSKEMKKRGLKECPSIRCPICGEMVSPIEGRLDEELNKWVFFESRCSNCETDFQIGEVAERCALCHETLKSDPYYDINEFDHHWCEIDQQSYCTPCFMQLFFEGYIDLSSNKTGIGDFDHIPTHVGYSLSPYRSRLLACGYNEVATIAEWEQVKHLCQQIANRGGYYLVLGVFVQESDWDVLYIVYERDRAC